MYNVKSNIHSINGKSIDGILSGSDCIERCISSDNYCCGSDFDSSSSTCKLHTVLMDYIRKRGSQSFVQYQRLFCP